jgi:hypothetical protein
MSDTSPPILVRQITYKGDSINAYTYSYYMYYQQYEKYKANGNLKQAFVSLNMANNNKKMCIEKYGEEIFAKNLNNYIFKNNLLQ